MWAPKGVMFLFMVGLVGLTASVATGETAFVTGTYSGRTAQKVSVGFELASGSALCSGARADVCLYQLDSQSANITAQCPGAGAGADGISEVILDPVAVPASGRLRAHSGTLASGLLSYDITIAHGTITGWIEEKLQTSGGPVCSSGEVRFSASRTGGVKR